ncbi:MAG: cation transporter [Leptospiraceae bacterium]|nr:MAG: cation transporter [Leptospiraceae bacterium]
MIRKIIEFSLKNQIFIFIAAGLIFILGFYTIKKIPIDAIPDLSDVQVIIYTQYPGQAPQVVEDQVTYPLSSAMLAVPFAKVVRGYSFFGFSLVYVIFEDGTDLYYARSRVLEYLNYASQYLPKGVTPQIGPDATGVGWVYMYALIDTTGKYDLQQLRSLQDWYLRYELIALEGVSEVASAGGFVKQYYVEPYPEKMLLNNITLKDIQMALSKGNIDVGGGVIEMGETEYMVRGLGYIKSIDDIKNIPLKVDLKEGNPVTIDDVANVYVGPSTRRGIIEWNGEGEAVAGIVIARYGENTLEVIDRVKKRLKEIEPLLPEGVKIIPAYDRSKLIKRAVKNVSWKLIEEMIVVSIVITVFLLHFRSSFVAIFTLPLGVLASLITMYFMDINANIMSLGGIAIAIGVMVDASVVLVENLHKHIEKSKDPYHPDNFFNLVKESSIEVGPSLFYSLLIVTISFLPVLLLKGESGRLFKPLAITKTFAMAYASILAITVIPVLMFRFVKGKIRSESENPISKFLIKIYKPILLFALERKSKFLLFAITFTIISFIPFLGIPKPGGGYILKPIGGEFMPPLNEGDLLYMPTTLPGISITKAKEILQKTDQLIKEIPEVDTVLGKIGRAETATDPAPLTMIETTIQLKPESEWRPGMTIEKIIEELNQKVKIPGLTNAWTFPIRTRIDMLSTGIKTPVGIKLMGNDLNQLMEVASFIEAKLQNFPGTSSVIAERVMGGKYLNIYIKRDKALQYGLTVEDIQNHLRALLAGMPVTITVEGTERYPIVIRYPRELRDTPEKIKNLWIDLPNSNKMNTKFKTVNYIPLSQVADIEIKEGPPAIKTENARKTAWIYVDLKQGYDVKSYVESAKNMILEAIEKKEIPFYSGMSIVWSGQYEQIEKVKDQLSFAAFLTIIGIIFLLYFHFRNWTETFIILISVVFSLTGGIWLMYLLGYNRSVATDVGFIALGGLAAETGIVMLVYLDGAIKHLLKNKTSITIEDIRDAIIEGAVMRVRPKMMTVSTTLIGLLPIMWSTEAGSRIMKRLAVPMIGGLITSTILTLIIIPIIYELIQIYLYKKRKFGPLHEKN